MDNNNQVILSNYCARLAIESENQSVIWKSYTDMYTEILKGYALSNRSNAWLVENMIKQIDVRLPWSNSEEKLILEHIVTGLRAIVKDLT